jgi:hypothetical protein
VLAPDATVYGEWTLPGGSTIQQTAITSLKGQAKFGVKSLQSGAYRFCVTGMTKTGYGYDAGANHVPACQSIVVGP